MSADIVASYATWGLDFHDKKREEAHLAQAEGTNDENQTFLMA